MILFMGERKMPYSNPEDKLAYDRKFRKKNLKKIQEYQRNYHKKLNVALRILQLRHPKEFKEIVRSLK